MQQTPGGFLRVFAGLTLGVFVVLALVAFALVVLFRDVPTADVTTGTVSPRQSAEPFAEELPQPAPPTDGNDNAAPASGSPVGEAAVAEEQYPDVVDVEIVPDEDGLFRFNVTMSSPYDSQERYADAWRVLAPDGTELGIRELGHDHADEQPFTRSLREVSIPDGIDEVTVEGRDQLSGWGGETVTAAVPR